METSFRIRPFESVDYEEVIQLWRDSGLTIKASDTLLEIKKLCRLNPGLFLVAEANEASVRGRILGAVIGAWDGRRAWIYHLAVLQDAQRNGIGRQLMDEVEERLKNCGALKVNLLVEPGNIRAASFYRELGYSDQPLQFFSKTLGTNYGSSIIR